MTRSESDEESESPRSELRLSEWSPDQQGSLTGHAVRGLKWSYAATGLSVVLQLGFTAFVSRRLDPSAFGLLALAGLVLRFTSYFSQLGLTSAIVQRPDLDRLTIRVTFTLSSLVALCMYAVTFALAPVAAAIFREPELTPMLRLLGFTLVISGLGATSAGLLQRSMRFRFIAGAEVAAYAVGYMAVGTLMIQRGAGVWSLVAAAVVQAGLLVIIEYAAVHHDIRPSLERTRSGSIARFGGAVTLIGFLEFLGGSIDTIAVGRFYGAADLGQYSRASMLAALPAQHASTGLMKVLLPATSRVQNDRQKIAEVYVTGVAFSNALIFPLCAAIMVMSHDLVIVLLGSQWHAAGEILPLISLAVALDFTIVVPAIIYEALRRLGPKLLIQSAHVLAIVVAVCVAVVLNLGLVGLAACWAGAQALRHVLYLIDGTRALHPSRPKLIRAYTEALLLAGIPAVFMVGTGLLLAGRGAVARLFAEAIVGLFTYGVLTAGLPRLFIRQEMSERQLIKLLLGRTIDEPAAPSIAAPAVDGTGLEAGRLP
jgi:lipopolysaccharide exporter